MRKSHPIPTAPTPYKEFFDTLRGIGCAAATTVITTNYDIVYEWLSQRCELRCSYPLQWKADRPFLAELGSEPYVSPDCETELTTLVCKLHGSVNYFEYEKERKNAKDGEYFVSSNLWGPPEMYSADIKKTLKRNISEQLPAVANLDAINHVDVKYAGITPAIIPPTYAKLRRRPWLEQTWKAALDALRTARLIIFIGYSMPDSDGFMTAMLSGAMAMRGKTQEPPEIYVIDPSEATHDRYSRLFGKPNIEIRNMEFAAAVKEGILGEILQEHRA
jgi:hypothetical protein